MTGHIWLLYFFLASLLIRVNHGYQNNSYIQMSLHWHNPKPI